MVGEPEFDIAFWKEHTEYKGYRPDDDTVEFFWKVSFIQYMLTQRTCYATDYSFSRAHAVSLARQALFLVEISSSLTIMTIMTIMTRTRLLLLSATLQY